MVALSRAVGQVPGPLGAVCLGGESLALFERRGRRSYVDALDVLGHVELQGAFAERGAQSGIGALAAFVAGYVKTRGAPEPVRGHRLQVGGRRLGRSAALRAPGDVRQLLVPSKILFPPSKVRGLLRGPSRPAF